MKTYKEYSKEEKTKNWELVTAKYSTLTKEEKRTKKEFYAAYNEYEARYSSFLSQMEFNITHILKLEGEERINHVKSEEKKFEEEFGTR